MFKSNLIKTIDILSVKAVFLKNEDFDLIYLNTGSKAQNVEKLSLDLIFYDICKIAKVLVTKL